MSLKGFHVLFIVLSIGLAMMMAIWALGQYVSPTGSAGHLLTAVASVACASGLIVYVVAFVRRARRIGLD